MVAISADWSASNLGQTLPPWMVAAEALFCIFYSVELFLRIYVWRLRYIFCPDWKWNLFDIILVISSIQEQVSVIMRDHSGMENLSFLRVVRLLKMMKLLRVVRLMKFFRELR